MPTASLPGPEGASSAYWRYFLQDSVHDGQRRIDIELVDGAITEEQAFVDWLAMVKAGQRIQADLGQSRPAQQLRHIEWHDSQRGHVKARAGRHQPEPGR